MQLGGEVGGGLPETYFIPPPLQAVCQSKKSWQARHTGIKIVQQIAILISGKSHSSNPPPPSRN